MALLFSLRKPEQTTSCSSSSRARLSGLTENGEQRGLGLVATTWRLESECDWWPRPVGVRVKSDWWPKPYGLLCCSYGFLCCHARPNSIGSRHKGLSWPRIVYRGNWLAVHWIAGCPIGTKSVSHMAFLELTSFLKTSFLSILFPIFVSLYEIAELKALSDSIAALDKEVLSMHVSVLPKVRSGKLHRRSPPHPLAHRHNHSYSELLQGTSSFIFFHQSWLFAAVEIEHVGALPSQQVTTLVINSSAKYFLSNYILD
eukprot:888132-Amphidinium_carterae.1